MRRADSRVRSDVAWPFVLLAAVLAVLFVAGAHASSRLLRDSAMAPPAAVDDPVTRPDSDPPVSDSAEPGVRLGPVTEVDSRAESDSGRPTTQFTATTLYVNALLSHGFLGLVLLVGVVYFDVPLGWLGVDGLSEMGAAFAIGGGLVFGVVLWLGDELAAAIADTAGFAYDETLRGALAPETPSGWVVLLGIVLPVVATAEELLFRAALIGVPAAAYGISPWLLAGISSAAFALGHGAQGRVGIVVTGLLGLALAAGYVLSGSLIVVVVAHYVVNATEFVVHERR